MDLAQGRAYKMMCIAYSYLLISRKNYSSHLLQPTIPMRIFTPKVINLLLNSSYYTGD